MRMNYSDAKNVTGAGVDLINLGETIRALDGHDALVNGSIVIDKIGLDKTFRLVCVAHKPNVSPECGYVLGKGVFFLDADESAICWENGSYQYSASEVEEAYSDRGILKGVWYSAEYRSAHKLL